jgi:hypothetical protein
MQSHPVEPRSSRLSLPKRNLCDGKALPPIQEFLARIIDVRHIRVSIAAHAFQRARLASDGREQIEIIDADSRARDLVQVLAGYLTG